MFKRLLLLLFSLNLAIPVWAAQTFLLNDVIIEGNQRVQTVDILNAINIKPGQAVTLNQIDAAIADMYKMERFSDISAEISEQGEAYVLTFKLEERPLVRNVRFEGNEELETEKLRQVITITIPDIFDPLEMAKSVEMVKAEYAREGYYAAQVIADSHVNDKNETLVTFRIKEGEIVRIKDIRFEGNTVFDDGDLKEAMATREKWLFSWPTIS